MSWIDWDTGEEWEKMGKKPEVEKADALIKQMQDIIKSTLPNYMKKMKYEPFANEDERWEHYLEDEWREEMAYYQAADIINYTPIWD